VRPSWYARRLLAMSPSEVLARVEHRLKVPAWRRRTDWTAPPPRIDACPTTPWIADHTLLPDSPDLVEMAQRILDGDYDVLGMRFQERPIDWHRDPHTGQRAPRSFAFDIDVRDTARVGRIKNVWEKSRHHHLTLLATAFALTKDPRYAAEVARQLVDWHQANPVMRGANWSSALELGIRLIAWVWIERLLRGSDEHAHLFGPHGTMWDTIYWHQWAITQHPSPGSSANNHLIGEMTGLFIASTSWPVFDVSQAWARRARGVLEVEIQRQTFASGLNRELAFDYHLFALEFFLLAGIEAERVGTPMSVGYKLTMARQVETIAAVSDRAGNTPRFGDGDDGTALRLDVPHASRTAWLFALGCAWAGARVPPPDTTPLTAALVWPVGTSQVPAPSPIDRASTAFADAGVYVLNSHAVSDREIQCIADAGPLGYLSIAAHGHADALSFTMNVGGVPVIVDPGTYVYDGDEAARAYFRGTRAHNTITVDGQDQSVAAGAFMWTRKANAFVEAWQVDTHCTKLTARHDGYTRLHGRPIHRRTLTLRANVLHVEDEVQGGGEHAIEWRLHFPPWCEARMGEGCCHVRWDDGEVVISTDGRFSWRIASGEPQAGWYSPAFNVRQPSPTLIGTVNAHLPQAMTTTIEVHHAR
jgi:hypothetical protein